jgi:hypothetical protein
MADETDLGEQHFLNFSDRLLLNLALARCMSLKQDREAIAQKLPDTPEYRELKAQWEAEHIKMDELVAVIRERINEQLPRTACRF